MSPFVVVSSLVLSRRRRCRGPLSSAVITFTTSRSTTVLRSDTRTCRFICRLASGTSVLVMWLLMARSEWEIDGTKCERKRKEGNWGDDDGDESGGSYPVNARSYPVDARSYPVDTRSFPV